MILELRCGCQVELKTVGNTKWRIIRECQALKEREDKEKAHAYYIDHVYTIEARIDEVLEQKT